MFVCISYAIRKRSRAFVADPELLVVYGCIWREHCIEVLEQMPNFSNLPMPEPHHKHIETCIHTRRVCVQSTKLSVKLQPGRPNMRTATMHGHGAHDIPAQTCIRKPVHTCNEVCMCEFSC